MTNYQNLEVWKKSMTLVKDVYLELKLYPREEMFGLTQQTKRAVVSISANIAEGIGRNHKKDTIQFLHISRGSLYEVETLLQIGLMLEFSSSDKIDFLLLQINDCTRLLNGLISYYEKSNLR
ncbi:MAG TPA: four helix bundle protein [Chitinophagaceae bacterium]|jgi:four helix bundle protein|nr:four helix bundle protein [Chitinophagaceae bacterium]